MKATRGQLPLPLEYDENKKTKKNPAIEKPAELYQEGQCHCRCVRCDDGYHCHYKKNKCGM